MAQSEVKQASSRVVPQPEPGLTVETLIERAIALRPLLREQQDETEKRGHYSKEIDERLRDGGFYRMLQPRRFGGYELAFTDFIRVVMEIARGDPGSAWCFTLSASHALLVGSHWSEAAQAELFGPTGDFNSPHRAVPSGRFERVEGGYIVNGTWSYSSGIPISTHFIGAGFLRPENGPPQPLNFIVSVDKIEILQDWGGGVALGMQGSGSNSVKLTDVFVPERHVIFGGPSGPDIIGDAGSEGVRLHGNPMYLGQLGGAYQNTFTAILTGAARAAIDEYEEIIRTKTVMMAPHLLRMNDPESQRPLGKALALADIAEVAAIAIADKFMDQCKAWGEDRRPITPADTFQLWSMSQEACFLACEAVDLLWRTAPVSAANRGSRLQRYFRDIQMYRIHPSAQPWVSLTRGQVHLGLPFGVFGLPPFPS